MTITENENDPSRSDVYGRDGYTAACPNCVSVIGTQPYFARRAVDTFLPDYQDLTCYECGTNTNGQMTVTVNENDPSRSDSYGRDGFTAACPNHVGSIGV